MEALTPTFSPLEEQKIKDIVSNTIGSDSTLNVIKLLHGLGFDNITVRDKIINLVITHIQIPDDLKYMLFYYASSLTNTLEIKNLQPIKDIFREFFTVNQDTLLYIFTHS